jgi:hypothetical protein
LKLAPTFPPESQEAQWHAAYFSQFNGAVNGRNRQRTACKDMQGSPIPSGNPTCQWKISSLDGLCHPNGDDLGMVYELAFTT